MALASSAAPRASALLAALALVACRDTENQVLVQFTDPVVALSPLPSGHVRLDGAFTLRASIPSWGDTDATEIWLDKLDVTTVADPLRPLAGGVQVPDGASLFPLEIDAQGASVRVPFTAASVRASGDELAWLCSHGLPMELQGSVYDAESGLVQSFYDTSAQLFPSNVISFARKDPAARPLAPRVVASPPQSPGNFLPAIEVERAWGGFVLGGGIFTSMDLGGSFVTGEGAGDVLLARYDAQGELVWADNFGSFGWDGITSLARAPGDDLFIGGFFAEAIDFGGGVLTNDNGGYGSFLARVADTGDAAWSLKIIEEAPHPVDGCALPDVQIGARPDGGVGLVKSLHGTVDLGGGPLAPAPPSSVCGGDLLVAAYDAAGGLLHASRYGDEYDQQALGATVDAAGNTWVVGWTEGVLDLGQGLPPIAGPGPAMPSDVRLFVAAFDPQGAPFVARDLGVVRRRLGYRLRLAARPSGGVVVAGPFTGRIEAGARTIASTGPGDDGFVLALDAAGAPLWARHFDHAPSATLEAFTLADVAIAEDGRVVLAGRAASAFRVDDGPLPGGLTPSFGGGGLGALFVFVLDPAGAPLGFRILACTVGAMGLGVSGGEVSLVGSLFEGYMEAAGGSLPRTDGALWMGTLALDP